MRSTIVKSLLAVILTASMQIVLGQQILFDRSVAEKDVPKDALLKAELRSHYAATRYVQQADFLQDKDFLIVVAPGVVLKSHFLQMTYYPTGSYSYVGKMEGGLTGEVSFSKYLDRTAGMIILNDGRKFIIDQTAEGYFAISQSREDVFIEREKKPDFLEPQLNPEWNGAAAPLATLNICDAGATCAGPSVIDLMIVYTPLAESSWGGSSNTVAQLTQAVTNMNTAMTNSGVTNVSYRLVYTQKVNYTESGDFGTDLNRLSSTSDGYMDEVHTLRNTYGADLVSLIIGIQNPSSCGIGWLNTSNSSYSASNGFNVSHYSCVVGNFTMSHEFGHNMGLRHDWYVDASTTPCAHHHGYTNRTAITKGTLSASSERWRTIMAYNNECTAVGISCTRINRWSNPSINYNSEPTGIAIGNTNSSDEAYAFYRMACLVAAFRPTASSCAAPGGLTPSGVSTSSATLNWTAVSGANSYDVDYTTNPAGLWTSAATATTSTSVSLTGLNNKTTYYWRVRTNCASGASSFTQAQFSTLAPCPTPTGLSTSSITTSSAIFNWNSVSGALSYTVEYKLSSASTWTTLASGIPTTADTLTGLASSTTYNWQVSATCSEGIGYSAQMSFTTTALPICADNYENNNSSTAAKTITLGTTIKGNISSSSDVDWFKFTTPNSSATNLRIILSNLPMNYNVSLYNKNQTLLKSSTSTGTINDTLIYNSTAKKTTYYVMVKGASQFDFTTANCYDLLAASSATPLDADAPIQSSTSTGITAPTTTWRMLPVPAQQELRVYINSETNMPAVVQLHDWTGRLLLTKNIALKNGLNEYKLNLQEYRNGMYILRMVSGKTILTEKLMIQK